MVPGRPPSACSEACRTLKPLTFSHSNKRHHLTQLKLNENVGKTPPQEQRSDYPKLKINVRGTRARFFINFAEDPPHRPKRRWTQVRCQQVGNVLRWTSALCKYVTFEPAIEPISASLAAEVSYCHQLSLPGFMCRPLNSKRNFYACLCICLPAFAPCPFSDIMKVKSVFNLIRGCLSLKMCVNKVGDIQVIIIKKITAVHSSVYCGPPLQSTPGDAAFTPLTRKDVQPATLF